MRLTEEQRRTILRLVRDACGETARVLLFGSRVHDGTVGGDVDLLLETQDKPALATELRLVATLEQQLGQPVDVIIASPGQPRPPIVEIASLTGVEL